MATPAVSAQTIAERIAYESRLQGYSLAEVMRLAGVSTPTFYRARGGHGDLRLSTAIDLLNAVGLKLVIQKAQT